MTIIPNNNAWCAQVTEIPDNTKIKVFNNGEMKRDFTYIDYIVDGVISSMEAIPSGDLAHRVLNLGNNKSENLLDFIQVIEVTICRDTDWFNGE